MSLPLLQPPSLELSDSGQGFLGDLPSGKARILFYSKGRKEGRGNGKLNPEEMLSCSNI